jgi:uncharacterized protein YbjQ (UPF0145 family)
VIITTSNNIDGHSIKTYLGVVRGIVVRSPTFSQGFKGGLKMIVGGNNEPFSDACEKARQDAYDRMLKHAKELGADAVIAFRYDATEFNAQATEVLAYGTAVKLA